MGRHPDGFAESFVDSRPLYMPISIDWDDVMSNCMIRLYDLNNDPTESINIAAENKELVEEMLVILNQRLMKEEGRMDLMSGLQYGMYKTFVQSGTIIVGIFAWIMTLLFVVCWACCGYCCVSAKAKTKLE